MSAKKLIDCRPGRQVSSNGQLDYLRGNDNYPTHCKICHSRLETFREDPDKDTCDYVACTADNLNNDIIAPPADITDMC